jgi:hypothetical protein
MIWRIHDLLAEAHIMMDSSVPIHMGLCQVNRIRIFDGDDNGSDRVREQEGHV